VHLLLLVLVHVMHAQSQDDRGSMQRPAGYETEEASEETRHQKRAAHVHGPNQRLLRPPALLRLPSLPRFSFAPCTHSHHSLTHSLPHSLTHSLTNPSRTRLLAFCALLYRPVWTFSYRIASHRSSFLVPLLL
jgi:hypothetical protein